MVQGGAREDPQAIRRALSPLRQTVSFLETHTQIHTPMTMMIPAKISLFQAGKEPMAQKRAQLPHCCPLPHHHDSCGHDTLVDQGLCAWATQDFFKNS